MMKNKCPHCGEIIEQPYEIGNKVYWISSLNPRVREGKIVGKRISQFGGVLRTDLEIDIIGGHRIYRDEKRVILTREAAERELSGARPPEEEADG